MSVDDFLKQRDALRIMVDKFPATSMETVWDQSVRYGRLAFETFILMYPEVNLNSWAHLSDIQRLAWIEVGNQLEQITLKENT
jgi:hypothetical protein